MENELDVKEADPTAIAGDVQTGIASIPDSTQEEVVKETSVPEPTEPRHETAVPYDRFKEVNEAKKLAEQRAAELEARLQVQSQPKQYTLDELNSARDHWVREGDMVKAMQITDMINDHKRQNDMRLFQADFEDRNKAEREFVELRDPKTELARKAIEVFNEYGNVTRSQAAEIAYSRLVREGKISTAKPQPKFVPTGQLGSGTSVPNEPQVTVSDGEAALANAFGVTVDKYKAQKLSNLNTGKFTRKVG